jgi:hypothetical protein
MEKNRGFFTPPDDYMKKTINEQGDCPLSETFTKEQVGSRIAFYRELNKKREKLPRYGVFTRRRFALYGWNNTTTVRVYMRETVENIAAQLFFSDFDISTENVYLKKENGSVDKDRGYVVFNVRATEQEIKALLEYIRPGASYLVYDGERSKYIAGDTKQSEFVITKPEGRQHPERFWRRSQSFIGRVEELKG